MPVSPPYQTVISTGSVAFSSASSGQSGNDSLSTTSACLSDAGGGLHAAAARPATASSTARRRGRAPSPGRRIEERLRTDMVDLRSALHRAGREAAHDVALEEDEQQQDGQPGQQRAG